MPINEKLTEFAKKVHDGFEDLGLAGHASAVRAMMKIAISDQNIEDEIGEKTVESCVNAISEIRSELLKAACTKPLTYGQLGDSLHRCLPYIKLINDTEKIPSWMRGTVERTRQSLSRLSSSTIGADVSKQVDGHIYVKLADCISGTGGRPGKQVRGSVSE